MPIPCFPDLYVCYMQKAGGGAPYLEVLPDCSRARAESIAARLLEEHPDCASVDLWQGDSLILSLTRIESGAIETERSAA